MKEGEVMLGGGALESHNVTGLTTNDYSAVAT
jgi:hypothetical protein